MRRRRAVAYAAVAMTTVLATVMSGCTTTKSAPGAAIGLQATTTSTTLDSPIDPTRPPRVADTIAAIRDAEQAQNFCGLLSALEATGPAATDTKDTLALYQQVAQSTTAARRFAPTDIAEDWAVVATTLKGVAAQLERRDGDIDDPAVLDLRTAPEFLRAMDHVDRYSLDNCMGDGSTPPPVP
jgi:hypothetical protein